MTKDQLLDVLERLMRPDRERLLATLEAALRRARCEFAAIESSMRPARDRLLATIESSRRRDRERLLATGDVR